MPVFSKITTTLSAILALTSTAVNAAPLQPSSLVSRDFQLSTHRRTLGPNNVEFVSYHPPSAYKTFHDGDHSLLSRSANATHPFVPRAATDSATGVPFDIAAAALVYLSQQTGIAQDSLKVRSGFTNELGTTHVYLRQLLNGIPVTNGVANMSFDKSGKVIAFGSSMIKPDQISPAKPVLPQSAATKFGEIILQLTLLPEITPTLSYVIRPSGSTHQTLLTWQFQLRNAGVTKWVQAHVDATSLKPTVVHVVDFVAHAAYRVVEWSKQDPTQGFTLEQDPADKVASPNGWHVDSSGEHAETRGNNVIAYFAADLSKLGTAHLGKLTGGILPDSVTTSAATDPDKLVFDYTWDPSAQPIQNLNPATVNAFYNPNKFHDTMYGYGFTEAAHNFQEDNLGKGGEGNDRVQMQVQAPGENNADFATPPDGQPGHCNMYIWTQTMPMRDGDLENDIITHELTHGLTNRMTGGGTGACLSTTEAGGMGEGWSDTVAFWSEQTSAEENPSGFTLGGWVTNNPAGIRSHPYSTNTEVDPLTYGSIQGQTEVHNIGEVWATILVEIYWALVGKYGFSPDLSNPNQSHGNVVFLHLLVDALPIQPCNPTFVDARDAIITADQNRYNGANKCLLWNTFAKRGLGKGAAKGVYEDHNDLPADCK